jgi:hypothetical protein
VVVVVCDDEMEKRKKKRKKEERNYENVKTKEEYLHIEKSRYRQYCTVLYCLIRVLYLWYFLYKVTWRA